MEDELDHDAPYPVSSIFKYLDLRFLFEVTERLEGKSYQPVETLIQLEARGVSRVIPSDLI